MEDTIDSIIEASERLGYSRDGLLRDAITMFLAANRDLREKIAVELYKEGKASLGKASEIANLSYEEMKNLLTKNRVSIRRGPESTKELKRKAEKLLSAL